MEVTEQPSYVPAKGSKRLSAKRLVKKVGVGRKKALKGLQRRTAVSSRRKKTPEAKLKAQLWELCKQITRKRYGNDCFTCGKTGLAGSSWQTGHFIPRSTCGAFLKYDLRNLRPQCYRCNIDLSGNGALFYRRLVELEGQEFVDSIFADKDRITKTNKDWYLNQIFLYTQKLALLNHEPVP